MVPWNQRDYTDDMSGAYMIDEIDRPEPSRPDRIVVEIEGAGYCQTDNHLAVGMWADDVDQDLPITLGHENAGEVVEVGEGVTTVEVGDKVICHLPMTCGECRPCRLGNDMHCENGLWPGLSRLAQ